MGANTWERERKGIEGETFSGGEGRGFRSEGERTKFCKVKGRGMSGC